MWITRREPQVWQRFAVRPRREMRCDGKAPAPRRQAQPQRTGPGRELLRLRSAEISTASFGRSCAIFDPAGNLADWDAGFASEFSVVAARIAAGASFREILRAALDRDQVVRLHIPKPGGTEEVGRRIGRWPLDLGQENSFAYSNGGWIVHVCESRTVAGGIVRAARDISPQSRTANAPEIEPDGAGGARGRRAEPGLNGQANLARPAALQASNGMLVLRSHTERELIRVREAAQAADRTKSEFLSRISHEIRTPMNVVLGMAEVLSETELSAEQRRYLELMTANGNALLEQIGSILDLARIGSGNWQIEQGSRFLSTAQPGRALNMIAPSAELVPKLGALIYLTGPTW
jgi:signal transduction histidine kinase